MYIQNIKLVWNSGTLCAGLEQENVLYAPPNTKSMVDRLSFFKITRPKPLQIGHPRHQSIPFYMYIQNIKLVWNSDLLRAGLEQENAPLNTKSMVDQLSFFKPMRPKLLQIGHTRHQSTPLYVYIQNIKLVWNFGTLCAGLEQENVLYAPLNTKSMVDRLSFFKPMRPKLLQIGHTRHQSTPLYVYIQNIKLVWNFGTLCAGLEQENVLYAPLNTKSMVDRLSFFKPMRPKLLQIEHTCTGKK